MPTTLTELFRRLPLLAGLDRGALEGLSRRAVLLQAQAGQTIVTEGVDPGQVFFVISGSVKLVRQMPDGCIRPIDTLHEGAIFPHELLSESAPSPFTVVAGDDGALMNALSRDAVHQFLDENPAVRKQLENNQQLDNTVKALEQTSSLQGVPAEGLSYLAGMVETKAVASGTRLIREGEIDDQLYIIVTGEFHVTREGSPDSVKAILGPGEIIGEIAVLQREPRSANVVAATDAIVYRVAGDAFRGFVEQQANLEKHVKDLVDRRRTVGGGEAVASPTREAAEVQALGPEHEPLRRELGRQQKLGVARLAQRVPRRYQRKPPAIRQHSEMDCGAACLSTVCRYYGKRVSINTTREMARIRQDGASMDNLVRAAEQLGFRAQQFVSTLQQLREKSLPAIVNWKGYHWIVVYAVRDDEVLVADPASGLERLSREEFEKGWSQFTIFLEPTERFDEIEESFASLKDFLPYVLPVRKYVVEIFLASFGLQLFAILVPLFSKFVIDEIVLKADTQWLVQALVLMAGITVVQISLNYIRDAMLLQVSFNANFRIIKDVYSRLLTLPLSFFERRRTGDITSRLEQHEEITAFLTEEGLETFLSLFTAVAYLAMMLYFDVALTVATVSFLFLNLFVIRLISPRIRQINRQSFVKEAEQESHVIESIGGAATLKAVGASHMARWKYEGFFAAVSNLYFKQAKLGQAAGLFSGMVDSLSDVVVLFYGGYLVIHGQMSIGELVAFFAFANGVQGPINAIIGKWDDLQQVYVAMERLDDILKKKPEVVGHEPSQELIVVPRLRGRVEFSGVTFRYEPDDRENVVQNINIIAEPGQRIALVGGSGCGKSTLIKLLYGFYPCDSGTIRIDGFDLKEADIRSVRNQIAMVPQQAHLFRGSILDNISLASPGADMDEIVEAAKKAGADEFIMKLPRGYDAPVEEGGTNLSGGQRQRIIIARALLHEAAILVLDEATSALDNESERIVMDNIQNCYQDKTIFMIAHRLSTIRHADQIICLNNGVIVETGTHESLMEERGYYYYLNNR